MACPAPRCRLCLGQVRGVSNLSAKILDLPPGGRESVLDRDFDMLVAPVTRWGVTHHDIFVWRHCEHDVNLKARSLPMMIAGSDHSHSAGSDAMIVRFEPLEFTLYVRTNGIRWFASLERDLKRSLHLSLSTAPMNRHRERPIHGS
jgi:hypothetical protein